MRNALASRARKAFAGDRLVGRPRYSCCQWRILNARSRTRSLGPNPPAVPCKLDHEAGYALVAPQYAMRTALPQLPAGLMDTSRWLAGSTEQVVLTSWLEQHASQLVWDEERAVYELDEG